MCVLFSFRFSLDTARNTAERRIDMQRDYAVRQADAFYLISLYDLGDRISSITLYVYRQKTYA
jgi:hypothetical protein